MTKEQMENIIQENMQKIYLYCIKRLEKFTMNFWGDYSNGYWELFERKLPGNLVIAAYEKPRTLEELSLEMGVSVPYLEDEIEILEDMLWEYRERPLVKDTTPQLTLTWYCMKTTFG